MRPWRIALAKLADRSVTLQRDTPQAEFHLRFVTPEFDVTLPISEVADRCLMPEAERAAWAEEVLRIMPTSGTVQ